MDKLSVVSRVKRVIDEECGKAEELGYTLEVTVTPVKVEVVEYGSDEPVAIVVTHRVSVIAYKEKRGER